MTKKQMDPKEQPEITKLAIGKPGGVDAEADKYETTTSCFCKKCDLTFESAHEKVGAMITSIVMASSAFNES